MKEKVSTIIVIIASVAIVMVAIYGIANTDYEKYYTDGFVVDQQLEYTVNTRYVYEDERGDWDYEIEPIYKTIVVSDDGTIEFVSHSPTDYKNHYIGQKVRIQITDEYYHGKYTNTYYSIE